MRINLTEKFPEISNITINTLNTYHSIGTLTIDGTYNEYLQFNVDGMVNGRAIVTANCSGPDLRRSDITSVTISKNKKRGIKNTYNYVIRIESYIHYVEFSVEVYGIDIAINVMLDGEHIYLI